MFFARSDWLFKLKIVSVIHLHLGEKLLIIPILPILISEETKKTLPASLRINIFTKLKEAIKKYYKIA